MGATAVLPRVEALSSASAANYSLSAVTALARGDSERLLHFVAEAESFGGDHPFDGEFLTQLGRLVPADWIVYCNCYGRGGDGHGPHFDRSGDEGFTSGLDRAAVKPVVDAESPVFLHIWQGSSDATKLSDFLTRRELHRTRMYHLAMKPLGLEDTLGVRLRIGPPDSPSSSSSSAAAAVSARATGLSSTSCTPTSCSFTALVRAEGGSARHSRSTSRRKQP